MTEYSGFKVIQKLPIQELQCTLIELVHEKTGAQVMHIANEDPENCFCMAFRTLPSSSNGVAHILEHTVLCGSKKYPVKDPFFAMTRRSLHTFMNALTGNDFTCYPAASQVPKDFYNLLEVYLDAVFHPNLRELSFRQEGHRLEFTEPQNPESPLLYKGIVYNEMKGVMTSSDERLTEALFEALFPNISYGYNSGGDPKVIPSLTYEELKAFHSYYYHPSHCLFFFYGNLPLEGHLNCIVEHALKGVSSSTPLPPIPSQPRFHAPVRRELFFPVSADEELGDKTAIAFAWLTCTIPEQEELLALSVLDIILMDNDASPLRMALLRSGLCKQAGAQVSDDIHEVPIAIILKGCSKDSADALEEILFHTLRAISKGEIPSRLVENAIHQLEFYRSEITGDHAPFGLSLFLRAGLLKHHGGDATDALYIHSLFDALRAKIARNPRYLNEKIDQYFLNNQHFVRMTALPDPTLAAKEEAAERAVLDEIRSKLSPEEVKRLLKEAEILEAFQKEQEDVDLDVLPKVTLSDVSKDARQLTANCEKVGNLTIFHHGCFTNGILYTDLVFPFPEIAEEDLPYVRLLTVVLTQMGCGGRGYEENLEFMQAHTGGLSASLSMNQQASDYNQFKPTLHLRGKALHRHAGNLLQLLKDFATAPDFTDIPRLKEIIQKHSTGLENNLNQNAMRYASNLAASGLTKANRLANLWYGLDYLKTIRALVKDFDGEKLAARLQRIHKSMTGLEGTTLVMSCTDAFYRELSLIDLPVRPFKPWKMEDALQKVPSQARLIASPVAFISQVFPTVPYTHPNAAALHLAANLFDNIVLHARIREQGGAYGGGASSNSMSGYFSFYSYRDPNIAKSLQAFQDAVEEILAGKFDDEDLEETKLEMIQSLDAPIAPGSRGDVVYSWLQEGKSLAVRQAFRDKLLSLTKEDVIETIRFEIVPKLSKMTAVVFAGKELLDRENLALIALGRPSFPIFAV